MRDVATGAVRGTASGFTGGARSLLFSPDGRYLVAGARDLEHERLLLAPSLEAVRLLRWRSGVHAFSPDSTKIASIVGSQWAVVSDVTTGRELAEIYTGRRRLYSPGPFDPVGGRPWRLVFSPDGSFLAVQNGADDDPLAPSEIRFFDVNALRKLALVEGSSLTFTRDSRVALWLRAQDAIICVAEAPGR